MGWLCLYGKISLILVQKYNNSGFKQNRNIFSMVSKKELIKIHFKYYCQIHCISRKK